jgi:phage terminase large subunit
MEEPQVEPQAEPKKKKPKPKLRDTQELFVSEYLQSWNATEAYLASHPKCKSRPSAAALGSQALRNVNIRALIDQRIKEKAMGADELLARLADEARASIADFADVVDRPVYNRAGIESGSVEAVSLNWVAIRRKGHLIKSIKSTKYGPEIELYDGQAAKVHLGRHLRMFNEQPDPDEDKDKNAVTELIMPADVLGPAFLTVFRDAKEHRHMEYLLKGGRGSTKSSFTSLTFIYLLINNPGIHGLAMRQFANTLRDSVYSQLVWAIGMFGLTDKFKCIQSPLEIEYLPTHQKIYFRGADKPEKIKSIKPVFGYIGIDWFEELDQFRGPEAIRKIEQSTMRGGELAWEFKTYNPPRTASNWVNKYVLIPKANQYQHHSTYLDLDPDLRMEWLGQTFLDEAEHLKNVNPKAYEHEYLGIVNGTGGMVFENVTIRKITDAEIAEFDHVLHGADWGYFPDPFSYGRMHYDAARLTLFIFGEYRALKRSNRLVYNDLVAKKGLKPNDLIIADSAEPKSIADFRDYGASIRGAEKGPDSVDYSMKWLQSLVSIVIDNERCPYHAEEFLTYELEQDKNGDFISAYPDKNNHAIDDTRYATNLVWKRRGQ